MNGAYILLIYLPKKGRIQVGKLGSLKFEAGNYAYVGSALNGLEGRINRHLRNIKKTFWHIDYLLKSSVIKSIYYKQSAKKIECDIALKLNKEFKEINGFGSSDCKCRSHLFFINKLKSFDELLLDLNLRKYDF